MPDKRRSTAIHEAAHAVADFRADVDRGPSTIAPDSESGTLGRTYGGGPPTYTNEAGEECQSVDASRAVIVSLLAGLAANLADGDDPELAKRGAEEDTDRAHDLLERWAVGWTFAEALEAARAFVRQEWAAIEAVAAELLEHETLDPEGVELVILEADTVDLNPKGA